MSLIERAVNKLAANPADSGSLPERAMALTKEQAIKAAEVKAPDAGTPIMAAGARFAPTHAAVPAPAPARAPAVTPAIAPVSAPTAAPSSAPRTAVPSDARIATRPGTARKQSRIHIEALRARGFVTPDGAPSEIGQQFRMIKRPLLVNAFG